MEALNRRPKPGEGEEELLRMQEEFLRQKSMNQNLQPAAQVTNLRSDYSQPPKRPLPEVTSTRKPSKYAQSKGLKTHEKKARVSDEIGAVFGNIVEKNTEDSPSNKESDIDDKVYFPQVVPSVLGDIIEKHVDGSLDLDSKPMPAQGFPVATKQDFKLISNRKVACSQGTSNSNAQSGTMDVDEPCSSTTETVQTTNLNLPQHSYILSSSDANEIHKENVSVLSKLSEKEILEEKQKLMGTLDPKLVEFIKSRRKANESKKQTEVKFKEASINKAIHERMDATTCEEEGDPSTFINDSLWENDVLSHPNVEQWLHFDSLEKDKLEWMKGIEESKKIKADEPYEARFDFTGYLLPYTIEYTEKTKTLFHHGDEPHRPGYALTELFELTRSTVTQQRVMALNTIAGVLEYFSAGTYKDIIDIPLSKIFFIIRIAMDENKPVILEPALKAMRNMVYNRIDEASLDALLGFEEGSRQPCLENDKSEIEDLESKESELKDFHLAEIDIIAALIRTDIIQRLYYILETIRPSFICVQYCLQILTRLARDSVETANKIVECEHLMNAIIRNFIPTTSINFFFSPDMVYRGKPILSALKLVRVLSLQTRDISTALTSKYDVLTPISEYISSGVDGTYGLRLQIEAFCILSNILTFGIGIDNAMSVCPVVVTALYKHVQGTDVYIHTSVITATHAAVVLQLVNKILVCKMNMDSYKHQIYPLLLQGVQKWMTQLSSSDMYTCGHLRLLSSVLDCCKSILYLEQLPVKALNDSLKVFATSKGYKQIIKNLIPSSNLLSGIENKDLQLVKNLMSLGGSVIDSRQKVLPVLNVTSPVPFLVSLFTILEWIDDRETTLKYLQEIQGYFTKLAKTSPSLSDNWFTRLETDFVYSAIRISAKENISEAHKDLLYAVSNKLCYILRNDKKAELEFLFGHILFNKAWFTAERLMNLMSLSDAESLSVALTTIENIKLCYSKVLNVEYRYTGPNVVLREWREPILPRDWIYLPILHLYGRSQEMEVNKNPANRLDEVTAQLEAKQKEFIIASSLEWILFNEVCFSDLLKDIDITDRFCRIMCVYLCDNSLFLDERIRVLLRQCVQTLFKKEKKTPFNFDRQLMGLNNFQDFYTQFLEQFQSVSYGDATFAACTLAPLAQKHNVKWRKLLWSEYAGCLRALDCPEKQLCYDFKEYLHPEETDDSLLKSYFQALSSNLLRPNTLAHRIASHHVECHKKRKSDSTK
ncbi:hypothetical protein JYU34_011730 [Plutella xylostella]|uniref:RNA polymerase II-associated protein 1 n=1 Tax=Plutella xylostella TaxID=51655 RepID=A0ABQ7QH34_PLUXY|nr:hypothetical protein JYU34_011730 [Plutella xylostella]